MIDHVAAGIMIFGAALMVVSAVGAYRFPGPAARLHAATKAAAAGLAIVCIGAGISLGGAAFALMVLVVLFQLVTAPIAGHILGRAALGAQEPDERQLVLDDLADDPPADLIPVRRPDEGFSWGSWLVLTIAWPMLWGDLSLGNIVGGALAAGLVVAVVRAGDRRIGIRPLGALRLAVVFLAALARGTFDVAAEVLTRDDSSIRQAVAKVELPALSREALVVTAMAVNLTPGTLTVEIDADRRILYVHVLHHEAGTVERDVGRLAASAAAALRT